MRYEQLRRRPPDESPRDAVPTRDLAELKAMALLAQARITRPPVDPDECAVAAGVAIVNYMHMQSERSALLMQSHEGIVAILVNQDHAPVRQRFSVAHEIGHWVLERAPVTHELRPIAARGHAYDSMEHVCDYFAACLLMPRKWIRDRIEWGMTNGELRRAFEVSQPALVARLRELGYYARERMK
ncbi:MAG TPA: ImmA/IrrE family metallo-endopeptidase [Candidatus Limnocylindria bacterium]|nr:ImmA/IrrE family metallo-endopeptidase [Candidatus Limnocylindria bacterium]